MTVTTAYEALMVRVVRRRVLDGELAEHAAAELVDECGINQADRPGLIERLAVAALHEGGE